MFQHVFSYGSFVILIAANSFAQQPMTELSPDKASLTLTAAGAAKLAELPMKCISQEYPNKTGHTIESEGDAALSPRQLHPVFFGCLDWHSSVHGHWMLVRLLKQFPNLANARQIRDVLAQGFAEEKLTAEAEYFKKYKLANTFERTYGWAWLLKLDEELCTWNDLQAKQWHQRLQPLTRIIISKWKEFLPKQTYPNRTGVHPNTAFGLVFALDYARTVGDQAFERLIIQRSKEYYLANSSAPAIQEPDGTDFLSPSLEVCDLMSRVLPQSEFVLWFHRYLTPKGLANITKPPVVSDRSDYQLVHLDGLFLSRAWCFKRIAKALPAGDFRRKICQDAARNLLNLALPNVMAGGYGGEHWLASFAVYALSR